MVVAMMTVMVCLRERRPRDEQNLFHGHIIATSSQTKAELRSLFWVIAVPQ
jgi:hypothetical protein